MSAAPLSHEADDLLSEVRRIGYTTVALLDADEVAHLAAEYGRLTDEQGFGCRPSIVSPDATYRHEAMDVVSAALQPKMGRLLPGFRCVLGAYVPKEPGPGSEMAMHQDWSTCDETAFTPVDVWVALTETGEGDGALALIPGSHRSAPVRGSGMPMVAAASERWTAEPPVEIHAAAGTAIVFHPGIIHGSGPNLGSSLRLAVISRFQPSESPTLHFSLDGDRIVTYEVEPHFYASNYNIGDEAPGRVIAISEG